MKRKLDMLLTLKAALPEFFAGCDPLKPELQAALNVGSVSGAFLVEILLKFTDP